MAPKRLGENGIAGNANRTRTIFRSSDPKPPAFLTVCNPQLTDGITGPDQGVAIP